MSWMVLITLLSLISFSGIDTSEIDFPNRDKLAHFTFYFVAAVLGGLFLREYTLGTLRIGKTAQIIFLFCIVYGIIIEFIQDAFTSDREGDVWDALANSLGALTGVLFLKFLFSGKRPLKWKI